MNSVPYWSPLRWRGLSWAKRNRYKQQVQKVPIIGFLRPGFSDPGFPVFDALREELRDDGHVEGATVKVQARWARGKPEILPLLTQELIELGALQYASSGFFGEDATVVLAIYLAALAAATSAGVHGLAALTLPILIGDVIALWRRFNRSYRATVAEAPEGLRIRSGLVETTAETIPRGRVQAVHLVEPLLWRPFGWCRLEVDVAGRVRDRNDAGRGKRRLRTILPVGTRSEATRLLALLVPDAPLPKRKPPRRARWKSPLLYRRLSFAFDEQYAVSTGGRAARIASWVPLAKVQSLRRLEGPVQRRLGLATVYLDTAGRNFGAAFRDLDGADSRAALDRLTELARAARRR